MENIRATHKCQAVALSKVYDEYRGSRSERQPSFFRFPASLTNKLQLGCAITPMLVSMKGFSLPTPCGLSDWHIEAPASPRNQKIGSPWKVSPDFPLCPVRFALALRDFFSVPSGRDWRRLKT
jgi:hypothetical protein